MDDHYSVVAHQVIDIWAAAQADKWDHEREQSKRNAGNQGHSQR